MSAHDLGVGSFFYHTIANSRFYPKIQFFLAEEQNHEKHEYIEHIMGYIMFRHRKLVVVLMRYIDITLLDA